MNKGLYCDRWRMKTVEEYAELVSFCNSNGVTDLYIHNPRVERGTKTTMVRWAREGFDPIDYVLDNLLNTKVHLWITTLLVARDEYSDIAMPDVAESSLIEKRGVIYLDPEKGDVQRHVCCSIVDLETRYPRIYGLHLERLRMDGKDTTELMYQISYLEPHKFLTVSIRPSDTYWREWKSQGLIDEAIPMMLVNFDSGFDVRLGKISDCGTVMLPAYPPFDQCVLGNIDKLSGKNIVIYSYATTDKNLLRECYARIA